MTKKQLTYFKNILLNKKKNIKETIGRLYEQFNPKDDNEKNSYDSENYDVELQGKEEFFLFIEREIKYLNRVEAALKFLEEGKYGFCKLCNKEIPLERLEAVPTADTCVSCKTIHNKKLSAID